MSATHSGFLKEKFPKLPKSVIPRAECGSFGDAAERLLTETNSWGSPVFANLDTWHVGDIPCKLVHRIARNQSSEVLTTFLPGWFVRFGDPDRDVIMNLGRQQFCSETWKRGLAIDGVQRERVLVEEYQKTLRAAGVKFAMPFALSNVRNSTLYLIYGTSSRRGVEKMKDAVWKIDPVKGTSFNDPRDPNQLELGFNEPDLSALKEGIVDSLREKSPQLVREIRERLFPTMYKATHVIRLSASLGTAGY